VEITSIDGRPCGLFVFCPSETPSELAHELWERRRDDDESTWHGGGEGQAPVEVDELLRSALDVVPNRTVAAIDALQQWLNLTIPEVARLVGASKSAVMYWKRRNTSPRPGVARNLYRVYALVRAVRDAVGPDALLAALTRAPEQGQPSAYDLLLAGRYDDAERLLRAVIFPPGNQVVQHPRLIAWDEDDVPAPPAAPLDLKPPVRRARKVTLAT